MKNRACIVALLLVSLMLTHCKKDSTPGPLATQSQTELLVAHSWRISQISDVNGKGYTDSQLSFTTRILRGLDFQFKSDNTVRASDNVDKQIKNGGTWYLVDDNTALDVKVTGFSGKFPVITLTTTKLTLRQAATVNGVDNTPINLEFEPVL